MIKGGLSISGLQEAQDANLKAIVALRPSGAMGHAIRFIVTSVHRYAAIITHVDTGALRASHRMKVLDTRGAVYVDPGARNPRSGIRVVSYGKDEEERGGSHAFYGRTVSEIGGQVLREGTRIVIRALP